MADIDPLSTAEVASILRVSIGTVNRWAKDGTLPVWKQMPGDTGARLYRREDVERIRDERQAGAA